LCFLSKLFFVGELGDYFYVVESGHFDVYVKKEARETLVASREAGSCVGELALMYNSPRAASVKATADSSVWAIHRHIFR